jgi:hypothetical protein
MPTVEGRLFDPDKDGAVVLRGGNVTVDTRFGGLDVVQKLRGCRHIPSLPGTRSRASCGASRCGSAPFARLRAMKRAHSRTQDRLDLENLPEE